jgi:diacylglycerol kinase (ATP)
MRATLFVNPHAGKGRAPALAHSIAHRLRSGGSSIAIIQESELSKALTALREGLAVFPPDRVVVLGGDGNVHWAIQELAHSPSALEVIPTGTGNDFARTHGFTHKRVREEASTTAQIDLGLVQFKGNERYFGQILSTGFDSAVNQRANGMKFLKGRIKYTLATVLELRSFRPMTYTLTIDGKRRVIAAIMVAVGNGGSYGGGMKLIPQANPADGLLDILILHSVSTWELIKVFPRIFSGSHIDHPAIEQIQARRIVIDSKALVYADGEFVTEGKIVVEIKPAALTLLRVA